MIAGIVAIVLMVAVDQAVKLWAIQVLQPKGSIVLLDRVFELRYLENRGAAFSILQNQRWFFVVCTILVLIGMLVLLKRNQIARGYGRVGLILVMGGAIGNLIDRILRGFVVDLFYFRLIDFPVFNVADIFVTLGGVLLCAYILFGGKKDGSDRQADL